MNYLTELNVGRCGYLLTTKRFSFIKGKRISGIYQPPPLLYRVDGL